MILAHRILKQEDCCELQASPRVHNGTLSPNTKKEKGGKERRRKEERTEGKAGLCVCGLVCPPIQALKRNG